MTLLIIGIISAIIVAALQIWKVYEPDGTVAANRLQVAAIVIASCTAVITLATSQTEDERRATTQATMQEQLARMELALTEVNRKINTKKQNDWVLTNSKNELQAGIRELKKQVSTMPKEIESEKIDVAILVGHNQKRPGGVFKVGEVKLTEYEYFSVLGRLIEKELSKKDIKAKVFDKGSESRTKTYARINAALPNYIIELHANAWSDEGLRGVEGLVKTNDTKAHELAKIITRSVSKLLETQDRGVKEGRDRIEAILSMANAPAVILETFFITNPNDVENAINKRNELSKVIASAIEEQLKG